MTNHIKKMLRIVEENLKVSEVTQELIKKKQTLVIYATLSHAPKACHQCGSSPFDSYGNQVVVKNVNQNLQCELEVCSETESLFYRPSLKGLLNRFPSCTTSTR